MAKDAPAVDFKALLEEEGQELRARLAELGYGEGEGPAFDANFADTSQVTAERGELEALAARLQETLSEVNRALAKLAEGTFGICEVCGHPISEPRLEAMPTARTCIDDAAKL